MTTCTSPARESKRRFFLRFFRSHLRLAVAEAPPVLVSAGTMSHMEPNDEIEPVYAHALVRMRMMPGLGWLADDITQMLKMSTLARAEATLLLETFIDALPTASPPGVLTGAELIAQERDRQVSQEGWTAEHDAGHHPDDLARAGAAYALPGTWRRTGTNCVPMEFPWSYRDWKPCPGNRKRELVKAGALIAAEIDRIQEQELAEHDKHEHPGG